MILKLSAETAAFAVFPRSDAPGCINTAMIVSDSEEAERLRALYEQTHHRPADVDEVVVTVSLRKV